MTNGENLYRLQGLDTESGGKRRRLVEVEAALAESQELQRARRIVESALASVRRCAIRQRDLDLELQGLAEEMSRSEQRLYGGAVKNPRELADLQAKVESLRRRRQTLEDDLLTAMIEREEAEETLAQARKHLEETEARCSLQQASLMVERDDLLARLADIDQARSKALASIAPGDLAAYQSLRNRKGGLAVARIRDGSCGACGVAVPPALKWQLREGKRVRCGNCERIIVDE